MNVSLYVCTPLSLSCPPFYRYGKPAPWDGFGSEGALDFQQEESRIYERTVKEPCINHWGFEYSESGICELEHFE